MRAMDEIYSLLVTIDYPDGVTGGLAAHDRRAAGRARAHPRRPDDHDRRGEAAGRDRVGAAHDRRLTLWYADSSLRGCSSAGRALRSQRRSRRFESAHLHSSPRTVGGPVIVNAETSVANAFARSFPSTRRTMLSPATASIPGIEVVGVAIRPGFPGRRGAPRVRAERDRRRDPIRANRAGRRDGGQGSVEATS